ncbi:MAG: FG-GAP repeat protein [Dehalococcoidia bacterium]
MILAATCRVAFLVLAAIAVACGSADGGGTPSATVSIPGRSPALPDCSLDLASQQPLTVVYGGFEVDYLGDRFSLASGDFNDDGFDDALIGAPLADGPGDSRLNSGEAYILFGAETLPRSVDADVYDDFVVYGKAPQDNLGLSVAAGDVNGDGIDDVLVGARFASPAGRGNAGETYVIFGSAGLSASVDTAAGDADVTISGIDPGDFSGIVVDAAEVTGDDADDIIIGAIAGGGERNERPRAGEVYVVEGARDLPATIDLSEDEPFFTIFGASVDDALPGRLAAGDVDGDGRAEIVAGAPLGTPGGEVTLAAAGLAYVIAVPAGGGTLDLAADAPLLSVRGARLRDGLGHALAVADVNDDGTGDVIVSARDADGPAGDRNNAGEVYVFYGGDELQGAIDLAGEEPDVRITGTDTDDSLGFSLTTANLTGDGAADIVVGAALADSCGNSRAEAGEVYLIEGGDLGTMVDLLADRSQPFLFGAETHDELGFSLATGDFNGDGTPEVIAGALLADGPDDARENAGEAYIVELIGD